MSEIQGVGRPRAIESPQDFEEQSMNYIEWVKNNPVLKTITAAFQGDISYKKVPHSRPMTQYGWATHLGIGLSTLKDYGNRPEFSAIFDRLSNLMTSWNIDGATCGDLSGTIVARIERLADKVEQTVDAKVQVDLMSELINEISE